MKSKVLNLLGLIGLLLGSCADPLDPHSLMLDELNPQNLAGFGSVVECESDDCPAHVALLSMPTIGEKNLEGNAKNQCTASLISQDLVVTNAHCIPKEMRHPGSDCKDKLWAVFPKTSDREMLSVECERIERSVELKNKGRGIDLPTAEPDVAIFRLARPVTDREPSRLDVRGFVEDEEFTMYRVTPVSDDARVSGRLQAQKCSFKENIQTELKVMSIADLKSGGLNASSVLVAKSCASVGGNSGSPIYVGGRLRGVNFGGNNRTQAEAIITNFAGPEIRGTIESWARDLGLGVSR